MMSTVWVNTICIYLFLIGGIVLENLELKYGCNPHQKKARITSVDGLPFKVMNGAPGYINLMDALNSWQLVYELKEATGLISAASFKHVSPAGVAVEYPITEELKRAYNVEGMKLTPVAIAYARARGTDRMSSFGDWIAISDEVDQVTAKIIMKSVSDGIIAPSYSDEALKLLRSKKKGKYNILKVDVNYQPMQTESRQIFGVTFEQERNDYKITYKDLDKIVTTNKKITDEIKVDMLISMITLKYTQSNSVCLSYKGQTIGIGAGQQSRIHCTRLASSKADIWILRQHPSVLKLQFIEQIKASAKDNAIDQYLKGDMTSSERESWLRNFEVEPEFISSDEKIKWIRSFNDVVLGSDAFIPFRDNIDRAVKSGVKYVVQSGGSRSDDEVIEACNDYDIGMVFTDLRLFHH